MPAICDSTPWKLSGQFPARTGATAPVVLWIRPAILPEDSSTRSTPVWLRGAQELKRWSADALLRGSVPVAADRIFAGMRVVPRWILALPRPGATTAAPILHRRPLPATFVRSRCRPGPRRIPSGRGDDIPQAHARLYRSPHASFRRWNGLAAQDRFAEAGGKSRWQHLHLKGPRE